MNKIIVDKDSFITIENNVVDLDILVKELTLNIKGHVIINDLLSKEDEILKLTINVLENSELIYNKLQLCNSLNNNIIINIQDKSKVIFNNSIKTQNESNLVLNCNINGKNNNCEINIKAITHLNGKITINATGSVKENISNNDLLENIRILALNDEENIIIPNLLVSSNEVNVNHNATISSIDKEVLFYLNSKGLSDEESILLISNGYLINNLLLDENKKNEISKLFK